MRSRLAGMIVLLLVACSVAGAAGKARGIWAPRWFVATPQAVEDLVKSAADCHLTDIFFQVRGDGMLLYPSKLEPRSDVLTEGTAPADWDPLADVIAKAHAGGIRVHAWINSFSVWTMYRAPWDPEHLALKHPDWLMRSRTRPVKGVRQDTFMDPGNPEVREHLAQIFEEVTRRYDVDGVHFDYIRYPGSDFCYCDRCLSRFRESLAPSLDPEQAALIGAFPGRLTAQALFPEKWNQWRRDQVTATVRDIYHRVKAIKPKVQVSASTIVWGPWTPFPQTDAYREVFQDWHGWMKEGILDIACPMIYTRTLKTLTDHTADALKDGGGVPVWPGIGCYINSPKGTLEQIAAAYDTGAQGVCLFAYGQMSNSEGTQEQVFKMLREGPFAEP